MTDPDATLERRRDVARTYDRLAAQSTWLLGERGVDDAAIARAVLCTMRGEPVAEPFTTAGHRNVLGRLALLWLWRGPVLASLLVVSGPARLERIAAGEGTIAEAIAPLRALEIGPVQEEVLLPRLRAILGDEPEAITDLWSLDGWALDKRLKEMRQRLSSAEAREVLEAIADDVAGKITEVAVAETGSLSTATDYMARARQSVGGAALDPARTRLAPVKLDVALADVEAALARKRTPRSRRRSYRERPQGTGCAAGSGRFAATPAARSMRTRSRSPSIRAMRRRTPREPTSSWRWATPAARSPTWTRPWRCRAPVRCITTGVP